MDDAQDWCLQCGAGAPGSLDGGGPSWRSAATILAATAILVLGAAAAAYAALSKEGTHKTARGDRHGRPDARRVAVDHDARRTTPVTPTPHDAGGGDAHAESRRSTAHSTRCSPGGSPHRRRSRSPRPRRNRRARPPRPPRPATNRAPTTTTPIDGQRSGSPHERPNSACRDPARHRRGHHLQPVRLSGERIRRPEPGDRRRHLDGVDRAGQPGRRAEDGGGAA